MKIISGTDGALYIIYLRYAAIFFAALAIINLLIVLPIYATGDPEPVKDSKKSNQMSALAIITILNITARPTKVVIVFGILFFVYSFLALWFVYIYWRKSAEWRYR